MAMSFLVILSLITKILLVLANKSVTNKVFPEHFQELESRPQYNNKIRSSEHYQYTNSSSDLVILVTNIVGFILEISLFS